MKITAYRIVKAKKLAGGVASVFDGEGARLFGGRWNSPGTPMVYTSQSAALAAMELLVHLSETQALSSYRLCTARFERSLLNKLTASKLPDGWSAHPAPMELQLLGDAWAKAQKSLVLRVPSAVVPMEFNYLINPRHPEFGQLEFGDPQTFGFDPRLIESSGAE